MLHELGVGTVSQGFHSNFRDWTAKKKDMPRKVRNLALAHDTSDCVVAAYRRSELCERLMDEWASRLAPIQK